MTPTRTRTLALPALVCAIVMWLLLRLIYVSLPPLPWTGVPALLLLALGEAWSGRLVRTRLSRTPRAGRRPGTPLHPLAVARMVALAKASSLAAAIISGLAAGFLIYVSSSLAKPDFRADAVVSAAVLGSALLLAAAALYLEYGCRVPPDSDAQDASTGPGAGR